MRSGLAAAYSRGAMIAPVRHPVPNPIFPGAPAPQRDAGAWRFDLRNHHEIRRWPARAAFRGPDPDHRQRPLHRRHHAAQHDAVLRAARAGGARQHPQDRCRGGARDARRPAGADRRRREGRRARRCPLPRAAQQPRRHAAPRHAAPGAGNRQGAPRRPAGRARGRRDLLQAQDAAEAIEIDYETLPAVTDARAALEQGAPQLFDGIPGNLVFDWDNDTSDFAATDAAFAKAAHVTTLELVNNRVVANSMEPRNAIGDWDAAAGRPVLYTAHAGLAFRARSAGRGGAQDPEGEAARRHAAERRRRLRHEGVRLSRAGAGGVGGRASSSGR